MGRKNKYETNVKPRLAEIPEMYLTMNEGQIADRLGVAVSSFEKYKTLYPELVESLTAGRAGLVKELKDTMRKKANGFYYTETRKTYKTDLSGNRLGEIEVVETEKYSPPDVGALHLLLKNLDDDWRNDDKQTMDLKREKVEIEKTKAEESW